MGGRINGGTYTGCDILQPPCERAATFIEQLWGKEAAVTIVHGDALVEVPKLFRDRPIDLLFIDDNHERGHVEREVEAFRPLMRAGGLMLFHDVLGVHEPDIWDVIAPLGAVKLVNHLHVPGCNFGGLGMLPV